MTKASVKFPVAPLLIRRYDFLKPNMLSLYPRRFAPPIGKGNNWFKTRTRPGLNQLGVEKVSGKGFPQLNRRKWVWKRVDDIIKKHGVGRIGGGGYDAAAVPPAAEGAAILPRRKWRLFQHKT